MSANAKKVLSGRVVGPEGCLDRHCSARWKTERHRPYSTIARRTPYVGRAHGAARRAARESTVVQNPNDAHTPLHQIGAPVCPRLSDTGLRTGVGVVLSIGKLAAGQARYYLDQAEGRVDVVDSVGDGLEDYYVGGRGAWRVARARRRASSGWAALSMARRFGGCSRASIRVDGAARESGGAARGRRLRPDVLGAEERQRASSASAMRRRQSGGPGRARARGRVRRSATWSGPRPPCGAASGGRWLSEAGGLVAAAFRHRTSRAGRSAAAHARPRREPRAWARRAVVGARRAADLRPCSRGELRLPGGAARRADARLGVEWTPVRHGIAEIARRAARGACGRSAGGGREIEAALEERGPSARGRRRPRRWRPRRRRIAASRGGARRRVAGSRRERWASDATTSQRLLGRASRRAARRRRAGRARAELAGPDGLTHRRSTLQPPRRAAGALRAPAAGHDRDGARARGGGRSFLASSRVVPLLAGAGVDARCLPPARRSAFARRGGRAPVLDARAAGPRAAAGRSRASGRRIGPRRRPHGRCGDRSAAVALGGAACDGRIVCA